MYVLKSSEACSPCPREYLAARLRGRAFFGTPGGHDAGDEKRLPFPAVPGRVPASGDGPPYPLPENHECSFYGPYAAAYPFRSAETGPFPAGSLLLRQKAARRPHPWRKAVPPCRGTRAGPGGTTRQPSPEEPQSLPCLPFTGDAEAAPLPSSGTRSGRKRPRASPRILPGRDARDRAAVLPPFRGYGAPCAALTAALPDGPQARATADAGQDFPG